MNRSNTSELPTAKQSIYPMTRQELAMPSVPWTRLRAASTATDTPQVASTQLASTQLASTKYPTPRPSSSAQESAGSSVNAPKFAQLAHGKRAAREAKSAGETPALAPQRHTILQKLQGTPNRSIDATIDSSSSTLSVERSNRHSTGESRTDIPERNEVAQPKFLKHAVRFGGASTPVPSNPLPSQAIGQFQKQSAAHALETSQLNSLRGVNSRGQVYTTATLSTGATPASSQDSLAQQQSRPKSQTSFQTHELSPKSALQDFLGEYHRSVDNLPIIQIKPTPTRENSNKPTNTVPHLDRSNGSMAVDTVDTTVIPPQEHSYWLQAAIQIIIGTIIVILLMNLNQLLRLGSPTQTLENLPVERSSAIDPSASTDFPVQQASSQSPVFNESQFTR